MDFVNRSRNFSQNSLHTPKSMKSSSIEDSIAVGKRISKGNGVSLCLGCSEGIVFPFDRKNPKKPAVSWHTTFPRKSSVLYLCGADGSRNCSTPRKVWLQLRRSGGKGCPLRGGMSDRKKLAGGVNMHCLPALSSAEQRYIKALVSRCLLSYQNHHGSFPRRLSIASPSTFFVRLSLRWKWSAAPISGCSIPSVKP